ncbi:MAG TPA: hypothetical protein VND68_13570 [Chloroflexia bacterium]|nr:hypothetical protein [Chloroflexia bacterium]
MNPDTLSDWLLPGLGIFVALVMLPTVVLIWHARRQRRPKFVTQDDFTDKFDKVMTSTNEATRLAREAFTTSVAALDATNLAAQDTRKALGTISSTITDQHDDLKGTLVKAMEDSRAVNRAVVTAVQGLVDHTREELSVSRSTANDMAEAVKALKSISTDFNQAVVTLRSATPEEGPYTDELSSAAITEDLSATQVGGRVGNHVQARVMKAPQTHLRDVSLNRGPLDTLPGIGDEQPQADDATTPLVGRLGRVEVEPGDSTLPSHTVQARPATVSSDVMELLQLYAGAFADLVAAYQRSRPLNDREIVELAGTYCTTWISRLQSLHERRVPAEVWQRFYMHAIALQTVNDFRSRLQGSALRVAAELWERQARNAPGTHEVFRKIAAEIRRQVGEVERQTQPPAEYAARRVS